MSDKKILVAYFSASGVTRGVARKLVEAVGGDLFEIKPETPYTKADLNWMDKESRSSVEMKELASRVPIAEACPNMAEYDVVFVGFPIWWYVAPRIIDTFLESYDFSGKTIIPFATSGGSGLGETEKILHGLCSDTVNWKPGKLMKKKDSVEMLAAWVESLKL